MKYLNEFLEKWIRIFIAVMVYIIIPSALAISILAALAFYYFKLLK